MLTITETDIAAPVLEELGHQIDLLDRLGGQYARGYLAHMLGERSTCPTRPGGMHHLIAKALRDIAADQAYAVRLQAPGRRVTPGRMMRP